MMSLDFYITISTYSAAAIFLATLFVFALIYGYAAFCFIFDLKFTVPEKIGERLKGFLFFDRKYVAGGEDIYSFDATGTAMMLFCFSTLSIVAGFIWPLAAGALTVTIILFSARAMVRVGKFVSRAQNVAHTHPETVDHEKVTPEHPNGIWR